jgi:hypothetical protein
VIGAIAPRAPLTPWAGQRDAAGLDRAIADILLTLDVSLAVFAFAVSSIGRRTADVYELAAGADLDAGMARLDA